MEYFLVYGKFCFLFTCFVWIGTIRMWDNLLSLSVLCTFVHFRFLFYFRLVTILYFVSWSDHLMTHKPLRLPPVLVTQSITGPPTDSLTYPLPRSVNFWTLFSPLLRLRELHPYSVPLFSLSFFDRMNIHYFVLTLTIFGLSFSCVTGTVLQA